jgi:hypothetical protein
LMSYLVKFSQASIRLWSEGNRCSDIGNNYQDAALSWRY